MAETTPKTKTISRFEYTRSGSSVGTRIVYSDGSSTSYDRAPVQDRQAADSHFSQFGGSNAGNFSVNYEERFDPSASQSSSSAASVTAALQGLRPTAAAAPAVSNAIVPPSWTMYNNTSAALAAKPLTANEQAANTFLGSALQTASEWMSGQLPDDVTQAVRMATSEASVSRGLGTGSAARNLTIRDLGLTSLDLAERGMKYGATIADQIESIRQFNRNYDIEVQNTIQRARALDLDQFRVNNELRISRDRLAVDTALRFQELNDNWLIQAGNLAARVSEGS